VQVAHRRLPVTGHEVRQLGLRGIQRLLQSIPFLGGRLAELPKRRRTKSRLPSRATMSRKPLCPP
jgi:hypothetical protein